MLANHLVECENEKGSIKPKWSKVDTLKGLDEVVLGMHAKVSMSRLSILA